MNAPNSGLNFLPKKEEDKVKKTSPIFTILLIICTLLVLGFLGYLIINPQKEIGEKRNLTRSSDLSYILSVVSLYTEKSGEIPEIIPIGQECTRLGNEICKTESGECIGMVNFSAFDSKEEIPLSLPSDPSNESENGTGYYITQNGAGSVTVCAPYAERGARIFFEKYLY